MDTETPTPVPEVRVRLDAISARDKRMGALRSKLDTANVKADKAIADYAQRSAQLMQRVGGDLGRFAIAKRDDTVLADLAGAIVFQTATATRHASTLTVELLAVIARHLDLDGGDDGGH